jgi:hypothetical protein
MHTVSQCIVHYMSERASESVKLGKWALRRADVLKHRCGWASERWGSATRRAADITLVDVVNKFQLHCGSLCDKHVRALVFAICAVAMQNTYRHSPALTAMLAGRCRKDG